jgi:hypothetical protein
MEILRVLKDDGVATIFLSCDPGILVRFLRSISTARVARRRGFHGYKLMISRDHRNHVGSLLQMAKYVFRDRNSKATYFPFKLPTWNFNGYIVLQVTEKKDS